MGRTVDYARPGAVAPDRSRLPSYVSVSFVLFCVIIPLIANGLELFGRACSATLFDPLPTPWHALLALLVPVTNFVAYLQTRTPVLSARRRLRFFLGASLGSSLFFCITFLPALPVGLVGIILL